MIDRKRDIYIRINKVKEIVEKLDEIKKKEADLKELFILYDKLSKAENDIFENWSSYIEEFSERMDHLTL
jgi:uncharacterized coiled-coil DUF342 family protein